MITWYKGSNGADISISIKLFEKGTKVPVLLTVLQSAKFDVKCHGVLKYQLSWPTFSGDYVEAHEGPGTVIDEVTYLNEFVLNIPASETINWSPGDIEVIGHFTWENDQFPSGSQTFKASYKNHELCL